MKANIFRLSFHLKNISVIFRAVYLSFVLLISWSTVWAEEKEEEDGLKIVSKTELHSAKFNMGISEDSAEDDLKRKTIGVGEKITIRLEAKAALVGELKDLEWIVKDEKGVLILPEKLKGVLFFEAQANPKAKEKGEVTVTVKTGEDLTSKPYPINVTVPHGVMVKKIEEGQDTPPQLQKEHPGVPFASAWMIVRVTIYPLEVNFSKMKILEIDEGYVNPMHNKDNRPSHKPNPNPAKILPTNQFRDEVALDLAITQNMLLILDKENPWPWGHKCWFRLIDGEVKGDELEFLAGAVRTVMNCSVAKTNKDITIKIDKFTSEKNPIEIEKTTPIPDNLKK